MLFVATRDDLITLVTQQVMSCNVNVSVPDPEVPMVAICDKAGGSPFKSLAQIGNAQRHTHRQRSASSCLSKATYSA
jgi:hypothetical protein